MRVRCSPPTFYSWCFNFWQQDSVNIRLSYTQIPSPSSSFMGSPRRVELGEERGHGSGGSFLIPSILIPESQAG